MRSLRDILHRATLWIERVRTVIIQRYIGTKRCKKLILNLERITIKIDVNKINNEQNS